MSAGVPVLPLRVDPLIAEANEQARRRRLLALGATVVIIAAAVGTTYGLRSSGNALGVCATVPSGWKEQKVTGINLASPTIVLTNFRFGRMDDNYGLSDPSLQWPADGVLVAVSNDGRASTSVNGGARRVARGDFVPFFAGTKRPFALPTVQSHGGLLDAYIGVGALTPATIALANQTLTGVRACSA